MTTASLFENVVISPQPKGGHSLAAQAHSLHRENDSGVVPRREGDANHGDVNRRNENRRVMAVVLPHFLSELALESLRVSRLSGHKSSGQKESPTLSGTAFAVVVTDREDASTPAVVNGAPPQDGKNSVDPKDSGWLPGMKETIKKEELQPKTRLDAVSHRARQFGIRPGQTIAEARALVSELQICELPKEQVESALMRIADSMAKFASVVSFDDSVAQPSNFHDTSHRGNSSYGGSRRRNSSRANVNYQTRAMGTLWLDVTGIGHLFGGDKALAREVAETVRELGHHTRVAVANGPLLARAFACWPARNQQEQVLSNEDVRAAVPWLPITALPVEPEVQTWLARLGVLTFADLEKIPRDVAASRLGRDAGRALDLLRGKDDEPLRPYVPAALPVESIQWDEPLTGSEPLLFALRGLAAKVCARLDGRGVAARRLRLTVLGDRAIARFRGASANWQSDFELVTPLYRASDLCKVMSPRLGQIKLSTPSVGLQLEVTELAERHERQLSLVNAESKLDGASPEKMAVLFGELAADIGRERFGLLEVLDSHRPERRSQLAPIGRHVDMESSARKQRRRKTESSKPALKSRQGMLPGVEALPGIEGLPEMVGLRSVPENDVAATEGTAGVVSVPMSSAAGFEAGSLATIFPVVVLPTEEVPSFAVPSRLVNPPTELQVHGSVVDKGSELDAEEALEAGASVAIGRERYRVERVEFVHRIDGVEWWSKLPASRDYHRVWLSHPAGAVDALVYCDLLTGKRYLQGFYD